MENLSTSLIKNRKELLYIFKSLLDSNRQNKFIITKDDFVYGLGENSYGELGFGHSDQVSQLTIIPELCNKHITDFNNGYKFCIALSADGKLYSFGENYDNQLGYRTVNESNRPKIIESLINENVVEVRCGWSHTIVLTLNGKVFGWGDSMFGQSGVVNKAKTHSIPTEIIGFNGEKIQSISCGFRHSMALTVNGNVFSWGDNSSGQLGTNNKSKSLFPQMIKIMNENENIFIKAISCGSSHSLLLSLNGDIYSFGSNHIKQLGYKTSRYHKQLIPRMIETNPKVLFSEISCLSLGSFSTALSSTDGFCYIWGDFGNEEFIDLPKKTEFNSCEQLFKKIFGITIKSENNPSEVFRSFIKSKSFEKGFDQIEYLSEGGYGQLFKAINKKNKKIYAIKRINLLRENAFNQHLLKEIQFMSRLKSEYVVEYKDSWIETNENIVNPQNFLFIQMKLCLLTLKQLNLQLKEDLIYLKSKSKILLCDSMIGFYIMSELMKEVVV